MDTKVSPQQSDIRVVFERLLQVVAQLRGPDGCPWDRAQTLESMRSCLLEESWEVIDSINCRDLPHLREELGDLLLNIILLSDIANSQQTPDSAGRQAQFGPSHFLNQVITDLRAKLIRRHPHVFGTAHADNAEQALSNWQKIKEDEESNLRTRDQTPSLLGAIHQGASCLLYALKLQQRAAQLGFDWPAESASRDSADKIAEELAEFQQELLPNSQPQTQDQRLEEELGDLLFSVVNMARVHSLNPELALERSAQKFRRRFEYIEQQLAAQGRSLQESSLDEMEALWQEAKQTMS